MQWWDLDGDSTGTALPVMSQINVQEGRKLDVRHIVEIECFGCQMMVTDLLTNLSPHMRNKSNTMV